MSDARGTSEPNSHLLLGKLLRGGPSLRLHTLNGNVKVCLRIENGWLRSRWQIRHNYKTNQGYRDGNDPIDDE